MNAPTLTGTANDKSNDLTWTSVPGAVKYRLRRAVGTAGYGALYTGHYRTFANTGLTNGTAYHYRVRGVDSKGKNGPWSNVVDLTPQAVVAPPPPPPPPSGGFVGWGSATTGGTGGTLYQPTTYAAFKGAVLASGKRIIKPTGTAWMDGGGESLNVSNPNMTIDGSNWWGIKRLNLRLRSGNHILTQLRLHMSDQVQDTGEADSLNISAAQGTTLSGVVVDHCSILWSNDVTLAILGHVENITIQHSIIGCGLLQGTNPSSPNGYGINVSVPGNNPSPNTDYGRRISFYRNLILHNNERNMKPERADFIDYVGNVIYNWGKDMGHGNPRGLNAIGNLLKKGPETKSSNEVWEPDTNYARFPASIYWANNLGRLTNGSAFTPTMNFGPGEERSTAYGGGPHNVSVEPMTDALAAQIVAASGPSVVDATDQKLKDDFTDGTGAFYNGPSGPPPHPSWP